MDRLSDEIKIYSIAAMLILVLTFVFLFIFLYPRFTQFSIYPQDDNIDMPEIYDGEEVEYYDYKFSKHNSIITSTLREIHCDYKPDNIDNGWKICEAIFDIENTGEDKPILENPELLLSFDNSDIIKDIEILYSSDYKIIDEDILIPDEEIGFNEDDSYSEKVNQKRTITGLTINEDNETRIERHSLNEDKIKILDKKEIKFSELKKREYGKFKEIETLIKKVNPEDNLTFVEDTIIFENSSIYNESEEIANMTENNSHFNDSIIENNSIAQNVGEVISENEFINEIENKTLIENQSNAINVKEKVETINNSINNVTETNSLEEENVTNNEVFGTGFFITEQENDHKSPKINTKKPFAIKIKFEIPKYARNSFNFTLNEKNFTSSIDPDISECGNLNSANGIYTLSQDVTADGNCFTISNENITLDCNGYSINYSYSGADGYGVISTSINSTIKNCKIQHAPVDISIVYGIYLLNSRGSLIENNTLMTLLNKDPWNNEIGILMINSSFSILNQNNFINVGDEPISLYLRASSNNNLISNNVFFLEGNSQRSTIAIFNEESHNNIIIQNIMDTNSLDDNYGIFSESSSNILILSNLFNVLAGSESYGIYFQETSDSVIYNNSINHSSEGGIGMEFYFNSDNNYFYDNHISTLGDNVDAIFISYSDNLSVYNNNLSTSGSSAFVVDISNVNNSLIENNTISSHGTEGHGLHTIYSSNNEISNNNITTLNQLSYGMFLEESSNNNSISNNFINISNSDGYGVYLASGSNNEFNDSIIFTNGNYDPGFFIDAYSIQNNFNRINITTYGSNSQAIYLGDASENKFNDLELFTVGSGSDSIYLGQTTNNNNFSNLNVTVNNENSYGLKIYQNSHNITIFDSVFFINSTNNSIVYINSDVTSGEWNFTNVTTLNETYMNGGRGTINYFDYVDIESNYSDGENLSNTNITIYDTNDNFVYSGITNSQGKIYKKSLVLYTRNGSSSSYLIDKSNYTFILVDSNGDNLTSMRNLNVNKRIFLTLTRQNSGNGAGNVGNVGGSGGGSGGGGSSGNRGGNIQISDAEDERESCELVWECDEWGDCSDGLQSRFCEKVKPNCIKEIPIMEKECGSTKKNLFDISLQVIKDDVKNSKELKLALGLVNIGNIGRVNATLYYEITDSKGHIVYQETEVISVETQTEFIKNINVERFKDGEYSMLVKLEYEGQTEPAITESSFVIGENKISLYYLLLSIPLIIGVVIVIYILYRKKVDDFE